MLREPAHYQRLADSFGVRSACAVALVDSGRSDDIDLTYADLEPPAEFEGRPVMRWLESLPEAKCRDLLQLALAGDSTAKLEECFTSMTPANDQNF